MNFLSSAMAFILVLIVALGHPTTAQGWRDYQAVDLLCTGTKTQALCGTTIKTGYSVILATPVDPANGKHNCINSRSPDKICCSANTAPLNNVDQTPVDLSSVTFAQNCETKNN
ncbi:hypothetical protein PGT21_028772 [Puccinia graminis f. sp. tritici]|uniref:Hydrophobin n=2 Tax=Puccinia graminis f. sp. tritici TaxID=56615 RepID=E3JT07_PUCGT|nr:uncharacterized protein PGTG_01775 [Puccinia graminis f. sp. tritici CRL 75-36-700-3]EFP75182.1 hypothetical protein PGTG_01775 [Puccinia graminis f. sp. tritici CRL 75-36-700-3]KAA1100066.1 hypothetical protein PGT21_028772 [Puccinia graminis f. sp. tritici]KAA1128149.1 hypothetical protein PGTUg99_016365 [Puccinia graminis f. sp. tritici]